MLLRFLQILQSVPTTWMKRQLLKRVNTLNNCLPIKRAIWILLLHWLLLQKLLHSWKRSAESKTALSKSRLEIDETTQKGGFFYDNLYNGKNMKIVVDNSCSVQVSEPEIFDQCLCIKCKIDIKQNIIVNITDSEDYGEFQLYKNYKVLKCINCGSITYKKEIINSEEVFQIGEEYDGTPIYEENAQIQLYPIRDEETAFSKEFAKILPEEIYCTYEEVIIALNNKMPLLT